MTENGRKAPLSGKLTGGVVLLLVAAASSIGAAASLPSLRSAPLTLALIVLSVVAFSVSALQTKRTWGRSRRDEVETVRRLRNLEKKIAQVGTRGHAAGSGNGPKLTIDDIRGAIAQTVDVSARGQGTAETATAAGRQTEEISAAKAASERHLQVQRRVQVPDGPVARPDVTAAVILDPFSELAFQYEWRQVLLSPSDWRQQIIDEKPDLVFLESAWKGNRGDWRLAMTGQSGVSRNLVELVEFAKARGIPTVLWNKEDPPNYDRFIETARLVDFVFTVDAQKIPDYRKDLGHERVGVLPFAAQPRIHNPIESADGRSHGVAFAGSYFAQKHDERRGQMEYILGPARKHGLEIYSRMQSEDERYHFPEEFRKHIVGSLPYEEMLAAYTQYKVFLNVNTVTESPSMCSRRLFELSAAGTPVVSGPAASVTPFFGPDVLVSESAEETEEVLASLLQHEELRARIGLRAHRRVMREHTYGQRVVTVLETLGIPCPPRDRSVSMVVPTRRPEMLDNVISFASAQSIEDKELVLVLHGFDVKEDEVRGRMRDAGLDKVVFVRAGADLTLGACMNRGVAVASGRYVAKMDDDNYYGAHYLEDLVYAFDFTGATVVGKWAHYTHLAASGITLLRFPQAEKRYTKLVQGGTIVTPREAALEIQFEDLPRRVDTTFLEKVAERGGQVYSGDRFNFVSRRSASTAGHTWTISDGELLAKKSRLVFYGDPTEHVTV